MMKRARRMWFVMGMVGLTLVGCVGQDKPNFTLQDEHYQQILERQKAGIAPEPKADIDLSKEMTQDEFEKLGDAHLQQGNFPMAKVQYEKALDLEPERVLARYKLAVTYLENKQAQKAYDEFHAILDYDFNFAPAYEGMGRALMKMEKDAEAEKEFEAALIYEPKMWTAKNFLGIVYDRRHAHKEAIHMYQAALEIRQGDPSILNNLGMAYYLDERYQEAATTFQQALQVGGTTDKISNNLGMALSKLGHYDLAFDAYSRGMDSAKAYNNIGVAFMEEGNFARASRCFEKAMEIQPSYYEKAKENLSVSNRMLARLPMIQQQTLLRRDPMCL
ncbi:MAG: tetratricopeptide repeat protein [Nitrospirales bacterium]